MALEQPKKPVGGAFGRFTAEKRADFQKQCAGQPVTAVTKLAAETWGKLSEKEKAPYQKVFQAAQAKYTTDLAAFIEAGGVKIKGAAALRAEKRKAKEGGRKGKAPKDPNRPKKPAGGGYGCFLDKNRQQFMKECPGRVTAVAKMASAKWKALSEKEKAPFQKAYEEKKAKYAKAMESYVPPAGAAGEAEESGEEKEEEKKATPSPAAKKTRKAQKKADTSGLN